MNAGPMTRTSTMATTLAPMALSTGRSPLAAERLGHALHAHEARGLDQDGAAGGTTSGSAARHSSTVANQRSPGAPVR